MSALGDCDETAVAHCAEREAEEGLLDLGGESAGEVDSDSERPFFVSKKLAAEFKHEVLKQYVTPWASKVGSTAAENRVVYLDGYAGPGRYADGTPGSPSLVLNDARQLAGNRTLECLFVEKNRQDFTRLDRLVGEARSNGLTCSAYRGTIESRLDDLLAKAEGAPLLCFLDPFGIGLPFDILAEKLLSGARPPHGPPTEVLLNFSANAVRRIGGLLTSRSTQTAVTTLARLDSALGGDWWRDEYLTSAGDNQAAVHKISLGFRDRICEKAGISGWTVPVYNKPGQQSVYYLTFFSRHEAGLSLFGESLSLAQAHWRHVLFDKTSDDPQLSLFGEAATFDESEKRLSELWTARIKDNLSGLLAEGKSFRFSSRISEIYGDTLGLARTRHLRPAVKALHKEGKTACDGKGDPDKWFFPETT